MLLGRSENNPLIPICGHGLDPKLCKDCLVEGFVEKKSKTPIKSLKQRSEEQERRIAKGYKKAGFPKARRQAMSGAIATLKADVDPGDLLLVEAKETRQGNLVVDPEWVWKVRKESQDIGRKGWYAVHTWVAKDNEHYTKAVIVEESLWFHVLEKFNAAS